MSYNFISQRKMGIGIHSNYVKLEIKETEERT